MPDQTIPDYIRRMVDRMDLEVIAHFFLYGVEPLDMESMSMRDRLKNASDPIYIRLRTLYPDNAEYDIACGELAEALSAHEHVYLQLGMVAGARLQNQLMK